MIYLDAHFFNDHPLEAELQLVGRRGNCVVIIDDFKIADDPGFGWDRKLDFEIKYETIEHLMPRGRTQVLVPAHPSGRETGKRRGTCVVLFDVALPDTPGFPGSLFKPI